MQFPNIYTICFYITENFNPVNEERNGLLSTAKEALKEAGASFPDITLYPGKGGFKFSALGYNVENLSITSKDTIKAESEEYLSFASLLIRDLQTGFICGTITFLSSLSNEGKNSYFSAILLDKEVINEEERANFLTDNKQHYAELLELAFPFAGD